MRRILTEKDVEPAVRGGSVYASGGGGWSDHGRKLGYAAVNAGAPELVSVDELDPEDLIAKGREIEGLTLARAVGYHIERRVFLNANRTVVL